MSLVAGRGVGAGDGVGGTTGLATATGGTWGSGATVAVGAATALEVPGCGGGMRTCGKRVYAGGFEAEHPQSRIAMAKQIPLNDPQRRCMCPV